MSLSDIPKLLTFNNLFKDHHAERWQKSDFQSHLSVLKISGIFLISFCFNRLEDQLLLIKHLKNFHVLNA